jgi:hypothetical protein
MMQSCWISVALPQVSCLTEQDSVGGAVLYEASGPSRRATLGVMQSCWISVALSQGACLTEQESVCGAVLYQAFGPSRRAA